MTQRAAPLRGAWTTAWSDDRKRCLTFILVTLVLYAGAFQFVKRFGHLAGTSQRHFVYLADALLHGRVDVDYERAPWLTELVPHAGKHYVVYPPMPAVMMLPGVAVLGTRFSSSAFSIALAALCVGLTDCLLRRLGFPKPVSAWVTVLFGFGTTFWYTSLTGSSWYLAHVVGVLFLLLALLEAFGKKRALLIGLLLGAAVLARLPMVMATPFFCYVAGRGERAKIRRITLLLLGLGVCIGLNMWYNWLRYRTVFDVGYYLIPGVLEEPWYRQGIFDLSYLPRNLYALLFQPPLLSQQFPYLIPTTFGLALFFSTPALLLMFCAPLDRFHVAVAVAALLVALPSLLHGFPGATQFGNRFSLDYTPFLLVLVATGLGAAVSRRARALIVLSCLISLWGLRYATWIEPAWIFPVTASIGS